MVNKRLRVGVVFGTRPEAIKLAPVIAELQQRPQDFEPFLISTAQHRSMLDQVMRVFGIAPDVDLDLMQPNQTLSSITCRVLDAMDSVLMQNSLDCLVIQGDTTTAFAAALAAFYRRIPVAHVEAGLRSRDIFNPFPEEMNRKLTGVVASLHCAPTSIARDNLLAEGIPSEQIVLTGNTVVDAVKMLVEMKMTDQKLPAGVPDDGSRILLITSHRRESWGTELENICDAIRELVTRFSDLRAIYPVHMNPNVRSTVMSRLGNLDRVHLIEPVDYFGFLSLLRRCYLVLTDSGGVQEEAPSFGKPVLVLRKVTERPEASMIGLARVVGTSREAIVREASDILSSSVVYRTMSEGQNPYGDGLASTRIVDGIMRWLRGITPVLDASEQFDSGITKQEIATAAEVATSNI